MIYNFVNGKVQKGNSNQTLPIYNPSTGEKINEVYCSNANDLDQVIEII